MLYDLVLLEPILIFLNIVFATRVLRFTSLLILHVFQYLQTASIIILQISFMTIFSRSQINGDSYAIYVIINIKSTLANGM